MAFTPNAVPRYARGPFSYSAVVPASAKTVFNDASNTAILIDRTSPQGTLDYRLALPVIYAIPSANIAQGKLQLYLSDGTNHRLVDEVAHAAQSGITATVAAVVIPFPRWSASSPLIVPDGWSLLVSSTTAQTAGVLIIHAQAAAQWGE